MAVQRSSDPCESKEHQAMSRAFSQVEVIHRLLSYHDAESDLSRLNHANGEWVCLHPLSAAALRLARWISRRSGGLFNFALGGRLEKMGVLPSYPGNFLEVGNAEDLEVRGYRARLIRPVRITLDGIAKGFAVDLAVKELQAQGMANGWVNAGGDWRVFGQETCCPILRRDLTGKHELFCTMKNGAMATSQVSEMLDPRYPGRVIGSRENLFPHEGVWTVFSTQAWLADALTKVACMVPLEDRAEVVRCLGGHWAEADFESTAMEVG